MSKHFFEQAQFLTYRAKDGSLVRHTVTENPWTLVPEDTPFTPATLDLSSASQAPNVVIARAPPTVLWKDVKQVAACLGSITSFKLSSMTNLLSPYEQVIEVTYTHEESAIMAEGFQLGNVKLEPTRPKTQQRDALVQLDHAVAEEDRYLAAAISAGTRFGSMEALKTIRQEEELLKGTDPVSNDDKVEQWNKGCAQPVNADPEEAISKPDPHPEQAAPTNEVDTGVATFNDSKEDEAPQYMIDPKTYVPSQKELDLKARLKSMVKMDKPPEGLYFQEEFLSHEEENLLKDIAASWKWDQEVPTRRTVQLGYHYHYDTKEISEGRPWPEELQWLREKVAPFFESEPNQAIVNESTPPHGFGAHFDSKQHFGPTIASIGTQAEVNFIVVSADWTRYYELRSLRRSIIVMSGEARENYMHLIPGGIDDLWDDRIIPRGIRVSYTIRTMLNLPQTYAE